MAIPLGSLTARGVLIGEGTAPIVATAAGGTATVLHGQGAGADPSFTQITIANDASDYVVGSWTPVLTAATPGNLSVVYSVQLGRYTQIGNILIAQFNIVTTTFTYTTATGNLQITGLPTASVNLGGSQFHATGTPMHFSNITKANFTQFAPLLAQGSTTLLVSATGSGQNAAAVQITDLTSGSQVEIDSVITYRIS